jgi:serine/threonine-protein kinase
MRASMARDDSAGSPPLRAPLAEALSVELHHLELLTVRVWQVFGAVGLIAGLVMAVTVSRELGLGCATACSVFLSWFVWLGRKLERGSISERARLVSTILEATIPWVFTVVIVLTQGADYALASWVPPMLFCGLVVSYSAQLRPLTSLIAGVVGGATYQLLYWVVVRDRLSEHAAAQLIYQPEMQISRSLSLIFAGVLGMLVANSQRRAFGRAESAAREQDLFGKYRLVRHLASGAMGNVFEAVYCPEGGFERRVAIKRIHPHLAQQKKFVDGFRREAELCSRLAHPNVIQVMDFGKIGQTYFLAMEFVDGMTLAELAERAWSTGRMLEPGLVAYIGREILQGLAHAHEARAADGGPLRIVHRDLCPQNVLLSANGEVKVTDFGVARALKDASATNTRTVAGHIAYMAPEQARGESVDARADLFPLGVTLWELLVGRRLFRRVNEAATLTALMSGPVPRASTEGDGVDPSWDAFLARSISRAPDERFQSAAEMAAALATLPDGAVGAREELAVLVTELLAVPSPGRAADVSTEVISDVDR